MKTALFVYNPLSGNQMVPRRLDYIIGRFMEKGVLAVPYRTEGDCEDRVMELLRSERFDFVTVSGGDGTVNMTASAMLKSGTDIPLGIIPAGTCNDLARSLNIPYDIRKCLDIILDGRVLKIDTGLINEEKYFLNTCAGGNFVDVSYNTNSDLKKNFGPLAYYVNGLAELGNLKPVRLRVETESECAEDEFLLFLILNGKHAAGFSNLVREADLSDGYMDIVLLRNCPHIELAGLVIKILNNDFINDRNVVWLRSNECRITSYRNLPLSVDGEKWKELPVSIRFLQHSLKVFVK